MSYMVSTCVFSELSKLSDEDFNSVMKDIKEMREKKEKIDTTKKECIDKLESILSDLKKYNLVLQYYDGEDKHDIWDISYFSIRHELEK